MSADQIFDIIKARFAALDRSAVTATDIIQYNITVDDQIVKTVVFNLKDLVVEEVANPNADLELTISKDDMTAVWTNKKTLSELKESGALTFKGDESLIAIVDERHKKYASAAAQ